MDPLGHGYYVSGSMHLRFNLSLTKARQRRRPTKILIYSQYPQLGQVLQIRLVQDGDVVSLEISESRKRTREHVMRIYRLMARCNFVAILFYQHPPPPQNTLTPLDSPTSVCISISCGGCYCCGQLLRLLY